MAVAIDDRLTICERAGGFVSFTNPSPRQRDAISLHFAALKAARHAVVADEIEHSDGSREVRILHYRSCTACVGAR